MKICVYGPSGCGKTRMLKMIAGELYQTTMRMSVSLLPVPSFFGSLDEYLKLYEFNSELHLEPLCKFVFSKKCDFQKTLAREFSTFSAGEQRRIDMYRAISMPAALYLVDEPLANSGKQHLTRIEGFLKNVTGNLVVVSHGPMQSAKNIEFSQDVGLKVLHMLRPSLGNASSKK